MLLLESHLPIELEVLDNQKNVISVMAARLNHMDGDFAVVTVDAGDPIPGLRWGAHVRFWTGDGTMAIEVFGKIVAHALPSQNSDAHTQEPSGIHEIRVRLYESQFKQQLRSMPRRTTRFSVRMRAVTASNGADSAEVVWVQGDCINIGAGGMRLRTDCMANLPERVQLEFALSKNERGHKSDAFHLYGRILRCDPLPRCSDRVEMAVKFERLSVEQGMALAEFIGY